MPEERLEPLLTISADDLAARIQALDLAIRFAEMANPNATPQDVLAVADVFYAWLTQLV